MLLEFIMALYSTSVETQILDPVFSSKNRCEFRIPDRDGSYLPNLRLGNVRAWLRCCVCH